MPPRKSPKTVLESAGSPVSHFHSQESEAAIPDISPFGRILNALETLPQSWQKVLWYADVLQEPPSCIAQPMGIAPHTVPILIERARRGLRSAYIKGQDIR
jgi:DNA-directed RNA polymerase specialized sigma24 family protein